ncbi:MAG: Gfo/Idh/MocA family oxidoreductase [Acidobacteriota bacterium]|nr:Gfo/Idh/MocA family oxidoreductase [Acidobacteriota bacterium]
MNRRDVVQGLSLGLLSRQLPATSLFAQTAVAQSKPIAANDRVNVGVIGPGSRGKELMRQLLRTPGVEIVAACDVYEPRFAEVNQLAGKKISSYKNYRELLERKDIDAIVIATPPVFHSEIAVAAMESGRPVYGEKTLGFSVEDCDTLVAATRRTGQIFQIGHQLRYASWIQQAVKRVHEGDIGIPTHVYAYWHRSDDWRRPVQDPRLEHLFNWRLFTETSGGLLEELGSHAIDVANWIFEAQPEMIMGSSSIAVYHDGRTVGDNVQAVIGYSKGRRMFFSSITDNALMGDSMWIYGTEGSLQITLEDATFYRPTKKKITAASHTDVIDRGLKSGASYHTNWEMPYRGPGDVMRVNPEEDPTLTACRAFIQCVREKRKPIADIQVGFGPAITCAVGKEALKNGCTMKLPQFATI